MPARSRAVTSSRRAASVWPFSDSSLTAASQTGSESGLALKASIRICRAPSTSPDTHLSLAPISQSASECGQKETALRSSASSDAGVPEAFSCAAARSQTDFFLGKRASASW